MALREDQIAAAVRFLQNDEVAKSSPAEQQAFLRKKGLTSEEIAEAVRRAPFMGSPPHGPGTAGQAYGGYWTGGAGGVNPMPPPPFWSPVQQNQAPWWALLLGGLGLGSVLSMLIGLLWKFWRSQRSRLALPPVQSAPLSAWHGHQAHMDIAPVNVLPSAQSSVQSPEAGCTPSRLEELAALMRTHLEESREATASLRRTLEQQQRLYQMAAADFQKKLEEAAKRKPTSSSQRIEIAPESLHLLKLLVSPKTVPQSQICLSKESESVRAWFCQVDEALRRLLRSAASKAEAKRSLQTTSMILNNLVSNPGLEKYREVSTASARFKETFGSLDSGAAELLQLAGFELLDKSLIFPADRSTAEAERVRDITQEALRDCDRRWEGCRIEGADSGAEASRDSSRAHSEAGWSSVNAGPRIEPGLSNPSLPSLSSAPGGSEETEASPSLSRVPWASGRGHTVGLQGFSQGPKAPALGGPEVTKSAPWLSSVVQKQLSKLPSHAGAPPVTSNLEDANRSSDLTEVISPAAVSAAAPAAASTAVPAVLAAAPVALPPPAPALAAALAPAGAPSPQAIEVISAAHPAEARAFTQEPQSGG